MGTTCSPCTFHPSTPCSPYTQKQYSFSRESSSASNWNRCVRSPERRRMLWSFSLKTAGIEGHSSTPSCTTSPLSNTSSMMAWECCAEQVTSTAFSVSQSRLSWTSATNWFLLWLIFQRTSLVLESMAMSVLRAVVAIRYFRRPYLISCYLDISNFRRLALSIDPNSNKYSVARRRWLKMSAISSVKRNRMSLGTITSFSRKDLALYVWEMR